MSTGSTSSLPNEFGSFLPWGLSKLWNSFHSEGNKLVDYAWRMADYTYVDVESNPNSPMSANQVFHNIDLPFRVVQVRIFEGEPDGQLCAITGWSSKDNGSPVEAYAVRIEDSSEGAAFLIYGGDWGVRLRPAEDDVSWSHENGSQWGEPYLVLADAEDIVRA